MRKPTERTGGSDPEGGQKADDKRSPIGGPGTGGQPGQWYEPAHIEDWITALIDRGKRATGCTDAGVVIRCPEGHYEVVPGSSARMKELMQYQIDRSEGPGLDSHRTGAVCMNQRLDDADRFWPQFAPMARSMGFRIVHAFPMYVEEKVVGSFTFADVDDRELTPAQVETAAACVSSATVAILHVHALQDNIRRVNQLETALESRIVIEQAKGMIAGRLQVGPDRAFDLLRGHARRTQTSLKVIARSVVDGELPTTDLIGLGPPTNTDRNSVVGFSHT